MSTPPSPSGWRSGQRASASCACWRCWGSGEPRGGGGWCACVCGGGGSREPAEGVHSCVAAVGFLGYWASASQAWAWGTTGGRAALWPLVVVQEAGDVLRYALSAVPCAPHLQVRQGQGHHLCGQAGKLRQPVQVRGRGGGARGLLLLQEGWAGLGGAGIVTGASRQPAPAIFYCPAAADAPAAWPSCLCTWRTCVCACVRPCMQQADARS